MQADLAKPAGPTVPASVLQEPTVTAYESALTLVRLLLRHGVSEERMARATGVHPRDLRSPDARLPLSRIERLWEFASRELDNPALALELHKHYPENKMHFVAHLGMRCPTMRSAIEHWRQYSLLVSEAEDVDYVLEGDSARFVYTCRDPRYESRFLAEHFLALACWFGQSFTGVPLYARNVRFMHADPGYRGAYEQVFPGATLTFRACDNSIGFDPDYLQLPFRTADSYLRHFLQEKAEQLKATLAQRTPLKNKVVVAISTLLSRQEEVTLQRVGAMLERSPRQLRSLLDAEGHNFRELVDEVRRHAAVRHLRQGMAISRVAALLGFSQPSAFQHAFRRWYGKSPGLFQEQVTGRAG
ncbi:AraC family transcriptional regulator [Eleftheria terrae]|uniref:AraC family transcriptional regulator n=1 Tax=Eleftheria terrae TaxID=1597781 RepID=UPI00263BC44B|nr:AraC family transcriptional regulator [Eleftheria terrae]WKB51693.1 AraC family transcriptional regulator ligand-binding domain-containing protein [Eleftheria terrae]